MFNKDEILKKLAIILPISLLLWGIPTLILYVGAPFHASILTKDETWSEIVTACGSRYNDAAFGLNALFCQGIRGFFPAVFYALERMTPFVWYIVASVIIYAAFCAWKFSRNGEQLVFKIKIRPWQWLVAFIVTAFFMTVFLVYNETSPDLRVNEILKPHPETYVNLSEEAYQALVANFERLQQKGCLVESKMKNNGQMQQKMFIMQKSGDLVGVYKYKTSCLMVSFFTRMMTPFLVLLLLLTEFLALGRFIIKRLPVRPDSLFIEAVVSAAAGASAWVLLLWLLAVFNIYTTAMGWLAIIALPAILWRHTSYWLKKAHQATAEYEWNWHSIKPVLVWLLISYIALNYLSVIRPIPIGWDDLGNYLNRPKLLVSYGRFIPLLPNLQWEYITSLGFLLFGYEGTFSITTALQINWLAGVLALAGIGAFGALVFGGRGGLLSALLYYLLPMVGHFSFADMKTENAVFFLAAISSLCVFKALFFTAKEEGKTVNREQIGWLLLAGLLSGFAFGFKPTAIMVTFALGALILGRLLHWPAFFGGISATLAAFSLQGTLNVPIILNRIAPENGLAESVSFSPKIWALVFAVIALFILTVGYFRYKPSLKPVIAAVLAFVLPFAIVYFLPVIHNNVLAGNLIINPLLLKAPNNSDLILDINGATTGEERLNMKNPVYYLPEELQVTREHEACGFSAKEEELDRYWGYGTGIRHYLGLPWRALMNIDIRGYYVNLMHALFLCPFVILLPFFWKKEKRWLLWLTGATAFMLFEWVLLANGVLWYGIGMFLGLIIILEGLVLYAPSRAAKIITGGFLSLSVLFMLSLRFWQLENQRSSLEYAIGKVSAEVIEERTVPMFKNIAADILKRNQTFKDRPYLYRVGTFTSFFIPRNLEIFGKEDNQLSFFTCLNQEAFQIHKEQNQKISELDAAIKAAEEERNNSLAAGLKDQKEVLNDDYKQKLAQAHALTTERLKKLGFNSIIFDTNTHTIERKPGNLHMKVKQFMEYVNDPASGIKIVVNRPDDSRLAYMYIE